MRFFSNTTQPTWRFLLWLRLCIFQVTHMHTRISLLRNIDKTIKLKTFRQRNLWSITIRSIRFVYQHFASAHKTLSINYLYFVAQYPFNGHCYRFEVYSLNSEIWFFFFICVLFFRLCLHCYSFFLFYSISAQWLRLTHKAASYSKNHVTAVRISLLKSITRSSLVVSHHSNSFTKCHVK